MIFISGAYLPFFMLPNVLQWIGYFNPLSYAVLFFRTIMLESLDLTTPELLSEGLAFEIGNVTITPMGAFGILAVFGVVFLILSTLTFVKLDFSRMNRIKDDSVDW